jgi:ferric-dicitrate binding protein FerR (iron transport regulator)
MLYNEDSSSVERLLIKKQQNRISPEELAHLEQLLKENPAAKAFAEFYQNEQPALQSDEAVHAVWQQLEQKILQSKTRVVKMRKIWFAVASILIIGGAYLTFRQTPEKVQLINQVASNAVILHVTGGKAIDLTSNNIISTRSTTKQLMELSGAVQGWNTIDVPQRLNYKLKLSDGTEVILNSATRLKFPFSFLGDKREVYVDGEAYFNIAKNADHPFIVHTDKGDITVLGTEFNVNTYVTDVLKTALVEGSVNVSSNNQVIHLKPGEELTLNKNQHSISELDERITLSWMQGVLYFHDTPLSEIAKMIERWYAVPVKIDDEKLGRETFTGNLEKSQPLEDFLKPMKGIVKMRCYYNGNVLHMTR